MAIEGMNLWLLNKKLTNIKYTWTCTFLSLFFVDFRWRSRNWLIQESANIISGNITTHTYGTVDNNSYEMVLHFVINDKNSNLSNISIGNVVPESDPPTNNAIFSKRDIRTLTLIIDPLNQNKYMCYLLNHYFR